MKKILLVWALGGLASLCSAQVNGSASQARSPDRISIFQVPLRCPAAPQIGCGSSAKPVLLELERDRQISEAWLNRGGTLLAVVWKSQAQAEPLLAKLKAEADAAGSCGDGVMVSELKGHSRDAALKEFNSGGWYRGADVDRLSEEEAGIIAARFVRRVQAKTPLAPEKAQVLEQALKESLSKRLIGGDDQDIESEIRGLSGQFLDEKQTAALREAIERGPRPDFKEK